MVTPRIDLAQATGAEMRLLVEDLVREKARAETAREEAEHLLTATWALATAPDLESVLERILTELQRVVPYDSASIQELHGDSMEIVGGHGFSNTKSLLGLRLDLTTGEYPNLEEVVRTQAPVLVEDAWLSYPGFRREPHSQAGVRSWLGVPLLYGDRLTGLLTLDKKEPGFYQENHSRLAQAFAAQASIAIENARLLTSAQSELSERRRAQEELERSEARYRELVENATDAIHRTDRAGRLTYVNPRTQALFGPEAELIGRSILNFVRPDFRQKAREFYAYQVEHRLPHTYLELPVVAKEGRELWLGCSVRALFESGDPVAFHAINRDVTERRRAEEAYKASEERVRAIIHTAHSAFIAVDADQRIVEWNPEAERIFGWMRAEVVGRSLSGIVIPVPQREPFERALRKYLETGVEPVSTSVEAYALRKDGREFPVELTVAVAGAKENALFHAFVRDTTDRKALDQLREDLTDTMVHDLRTPLTSVRGALELLIGGHGGDALPDKQRRLARIAEVNCRRLLDLVNAILDVSRLESGALKLERAWVSVEELVLEAWELQRPIADPKRLTFVSEAMPGLPNAWIDRALLSRVLQNLIGNAVKFSSEGGHVLVALRADDEEAGCLRVSVSDTGPGIPEALRGLLFQKFVTGGQTGRGSGLGLAFCRLAVEAHGGRIWVESPKGPGATISLTLPPLAPDLDPSPSPPRT